jgi:hypothetical protein
MTCEFVTLPNGGTAIICGPKKRLSKCFCGKPATRLCDGPRMKRNRLGDTCDRPLCDEHAVRIDADHDLCPRHAAERAASKQLDLEGI